MSGCSGVRAGLNDTPMLHALSPDCHKLGMSFLGSPGWVVLEVKGGSRSCKELDIIVAVDCGRWRGRDCTVNSSVDGRTSVRLVVV
ncbi:hypothetical protein AVEN_40227-1 [Araneus ventricosus]|uniref:Uncharacterized protein n=1 Tax=Araneus ventricosus TaxID=182803 RepID=A0A4Y2LI32_ARAVE|nr:hypothetical protein AVEN_40227-1 [Araneus ventricosus]